MGKIIPTAALKQHPGKRRAPSRNATTVAVPTALLAEIVALYAALAQTYDLAPITLTPKAPCEALLTLIGLRTAELRSLFERS